MATVSSVLESLLREERTFPPPPAFAARANVRDPGVYERAAADPLGFWAEAAQELDWIRPWQEVLVWEPPFAQWFVGGQLNACANCLDRHLARRGDKLALLWEGEPGDTRRLTYRDLHREVVRTAGALRRLGVGKGDRVAIYLPLVPEAVVAMLACARIGAAHSVVFGGFSADALRDRIRDAEAKVLITADGGYRRGQVVPLKRNADEALEAEGGCPSIERVLVLRRHPDGPILGGAQLRPGRDIDWHEALAAAHEDVPPEPMDAEDLLYILYTSGTTGKPKGIVHTTGGYLAHVHRTAHWVFDLKDEDIYWCTADVGWVTGHSYVVYGPLSNGATVFLYEGAPDWPARDRFWSLVERYRVSIFYTAPTAIRAFMKWGEQHPAAHDLSSLRLLGSVGEPINPEAWVWYYHHIGGQRCPVVDTWWQTETGGILITPLPGITPTVPGSATVPFPAVAAEVLDDEGRAVPPGQGGYLALLRPWPGMTRGIWGDPERFRAIYWSKWAGKRVRTPAVEVDGAAVYFPGDGAKRDERGYFWIVGRVDDVLNVAGHRIGTMEVESALVDHPAVAEAAVIGRPHEIKGQAIVAFVTLKEGHAPSPALADELKAHVAKKIGAIARPDEILFAADLPKTRSGKIMRRLLRDIAEGRALGDTTTLADPAVVQRLKDEYEEKE